MNIFDAIILIALTLFALEGYNRGFFQESLHVIGLVIVLYLSFILMNPLGNIFLQTFPIISLSIIGVEIESLNIIFYQLIAFIILFTIIYAILKLILIVTGIIGKVVGLKKLLKLPFKLLGIVVGLISGYITIFLLLVVLSIPLGSKFQDYRNSKIKDEILNNKIMQIKPIKRVTNSVTEIYTLANDIENDNKKIKHTKKYNASAMDIMLKNRLVSIEVIDSLIKQERLHNYNELNKILQKYRK